MHRITTKPAKYRFRCRAAERYDSVREGHSNWYVIDGHFRCKSCANARRAGKGEIEPEYEYLRDIQTGELVGREEIAIEVGSNASVTGV